jgi:Rrf2 family protein
VQARETAERQGDPLRYLEQILQDLRRAGLVEAKRGPGGGYALARPRAEVRLSDVVAALDGPVEELLSWEEPPEASARRRRRRARRWSGASWPARWRAVRRRSPCRIWCAAPRPGRGPRRGAPQMYFI